MGNWYIGWFAWVITLSVAIFLRGILLYIDNTDNDGDDKALDNDIIMKRNNATNFIETSGREEIYYIRKLHLENSEIHKKS